MPDRLNCPQCGQPVNIYMQSCPICHADLTPTGSGPGMAAALYPSSPEGLIPRLGDILIEKKLVRQQELQSALAQQRESIAKGHTKLLGQVLVDNGWISREELDKVVTEQILSLQSALQESNRQLEQRVQQRTGDLQGRLVQIRTAAEITHVAISANRLDELLERTVSLITERLKYYYAAVYLKSETTGALQMAAASNPACLERQLQQTHDPRYPKTMIAWTAANNRSRLASDVRREALYWADPLLPETRSEATVPITLGDQMVGVLDVHSTWVNAFDDEAIAVLQTIANHIAAVIQNFRLLDQTRTNLERSLQLNETNHRINLADSNEGIFHEVASFLESFRRPALLLVSTLLAAAGVEPLARHEPSSGQSEARAAAAAPGKEQGGFRIYSAHHLPHPEVRLPATINVPPARLSAQMPLGQMVFNLPRTKTQTGGRETVTGWMAPLMSAHDWLECNTVSLIPIRQAAQLTAVLVINIRPKNTDTGGLDPSLALPALLQPFISLAEQASTAMEKLVAVENLQRQLGALQSLDAISKSIALETDASRLYRTIHQQLRELLGDVDFVLAEVVSREPVPGRQPGSEPRVSEERAGDGRARDGRAREPMIEIPYAYENGQALSLPPMPLGDGLTSIIIRTRQPLMLTGNVMEQASRMGAKVVGKPAKSWMGVPLQVANEVIGAIIVQDVKREGRFSESDLRILYTLSTQIAIAVRNARLYQSASVHATQERLAADLTARLWSTPDIETILSAALQDMGSKLRAADGFIELSFEQPGSNQAGSEVMA